MLVLQALIDCQGECKSLMAPYLRCLKQNRGTNAPECREFARLYLQCRMERYVLCLGLLIRKRPSGFIFRYADIYCKKPHGSRRVPKLRLRRLHRKVSGQDIAAEYQARGGQVTDFRRSKQWQEHVCVALMEITQRQ